MLLLCVRQRHSEVTTAANIRCYRWLLLLLLLCGVGCCAMPCCTLNAYTRLQVCSHTHIYIQTNINLLKRASPACNMQHFYQFPFFHCFYFRLPCWMSFSLLLLLLLLLLLPCHLCRWPLNNCVVKWPLRCWLRMRASNFYCKCCCCCCAIVVCAFWHNAGASAPHLYVGFQLPHLRFAATLLWRWCAFYLLVAWL